MRIKKIVFFSFMPISNNTIKKYYIEELIRAGFELSYLDMKELFKYWNTDDVVEDRLSIVYYIKSYKDFEQYLDIQDNNHTLFLSQITYNCSFLRLFHLLSKKGFKVGCLAVGMLPPIQLNLKERMNSISIKKIVRFIGNRLTRFWLYCGFIDCYSVIFKVGNVLNNNDYSNLLMDLSKADYVVNINDTDYDLALQVHETPKCLFKPYILFLDQYLPFHPDIDVIGGKRINSFLYYKMLNSFFTKIENKYGMEVVIAAHPKAEQYMKHNYFGGRKVYFGKTALLSRDAAFILLHNTTSVGFASIYKKYICFITSEEIMKHMPVTHAAILNFAIFFNAPLLFFDNSDLSMLDYKIDMRKFDMRKFDEYKYTYLTSTVSERHRSIDIIINFLKQDF